MPRNRPDANKARLVALWRRAGGEWWDMPREAGFDGVACWRGRVLLVEIKDGSKPPSEQKLTENEQINKGKIEDQGVPYTIWRSEADVIAELQR